MDNFTLSLRDTSQRIDTALFEAYKKSHRSALAQIIHTPPLYQNDTGWMDINKWASPKRIATLISLSTELATRVDTLVVIGIGGSNNAARATLSALQKKSSINVIFAGNTLSSYETEQILESLKGKEYAIQVIAKNFETLEPGVAFRILRKDLHQRYGHHAHRYIYITGSRGSLTEKLADQEGYTFLTFPSDIGGRYSALSDVGLFPMAAGGVDIQSLVHGAQIMKDYLYTCPTLLNPAFTYATARNYLNEQHFTCEMLSFFEPRLQGFSLWWKQLLAESEGKEGKGLFPLSSCFSEDLHSIGQYIQEGENFIFETFIKIYNDGSSPILIEKDGVDDHFDYLNGMSLSHINQVAEEATLAAHSHRFPCIEINIPVLNEEAIGTLFYFFEFSIYLSAQILGVNPFDQPGVEAYKKRMFQGLER